MKIKARKILILILGFVFTFGIFTFGASYVSANEGENNQTESGSVLNHEDKTLTADEMVESFTEEFIRVGSAEAFLNAINEVEEPHIQLIRNIILTGEAIIIDKKVVIDTAGSNITYVNPQTIDDSVFEIIKDGDLIILNSSAYTGSRADTSVIDLRNKRSINKVNLFSLLGDESYLEDEQPKLTISGNIT